MNKFATISLFLGCLLLSLIASLFITWLAWQFQITEKAFHCTDLSVGGFWDDMDEHRAAGDTLLAGWTWAELKTVRSFYEAGFYTMWIGGGLLAYGAIRRFFKLATLSLPNPAPEPGSDPHRGCMPESP